MMIRRNSIVIIAIALLAFGFNSCKKKKYKGKVVEPLPYFPAYPGSSWEYSDGSKITVADSYVDLCGSEKAVPYVKWSHWGNPQYVLGYDRSENNCTSFYGFLREYKSAITTPYGYMGVYTFWNVVNTDSTIIVGGNTYNHVIAVSTADGNLPFGFAMWQSMDFYARDIGLIRRDKQFYHLDSLGFHQDSTGIDFYLTKCKINK